MRVCWLIEDPIMNSSTTVQAQNDFDGHDRASRMHCGMDGISQDIHTSRPAGAASSAINPHIQGHRYSDRFTRCRYTTADAAPYASVQSCLHTSEANNATTPDVESHGGSKHPSLASSSRNKP